MKKINLPILILLVFASISFSQNSILDSILTKINLDTLRLYVRQLSGDTASTIGGISYTIASRNKNQPGNQKAAEYIYAKFQSYGLNAAYENFSTTGNNVIGTKTGTLYPNRYYIVCAHYDDMPSGTLAPGADDNASGTAGFLEIARIFSKYNFPYTVKFIGFDEEEQGLIGSVYFATQARNRNDSIMGVLNLDMISYDGNNDNRINVHTKNIANTAEIVQDLVNNNLSFSIGLDIVVVPSQPYSDHDSFYGKNYGATLIIEDDYDFHPQYHTVNDKISYFNWPYFLKNVKLTAVTLAKYASNFKIILGHTQLASTNITAPRTAELSVNTGLAIATGLGAPRLFYRTIISGVTSQWYSVTDISGPIGSLYDFIIPGQQLGTKVEYYFGVQDASGSLVLTLPAGGNGFNPPGSNPPPTFYSYLVANTLVLINDPADNLDHWLSQALWCKVTSSYVSAPSSFKDNPNSTYPSSTTNIFWLKDTINVPSSVLGADLTFFTKFDLESKYDYVQLQISTNYGQTWASIAGKYTIMSTGTFQPPNEPVYNGTQSSWVKEEISLNAYQGKALQFRFYFKSDASVNKEGMYIDDFNISAYTTSGASSTATFTTNDGWNLVSTPLTLINMSAVSIFPQASSNAFGYNQNYFVCDTLKLGGGYWLKFNLPVSHNLTGNASSSFDIPIKQGWNLVGALNYSKPVSSITTNPSGILVSSFFEYNSAYQQAVNLEKGKGYWIKAQQDGFINYTPSTTKVADNYYNLNKFTDKLVLTDSENKSIVLYFSRENINTGVLEMPPVPPANAFDIRFASNSLIANLSDLNQININYAKFPLTFEFLTKDNTNIILTNNSNINENYKLKNGDKIVLSGNSNSISVKSDFTPSDFSLSQNYPNPFNPGTIIKYSIPVDGYVLLTVFNGLGQEIKTIVNEIQKAGNYNIYFEASDLSSGVYYYEIKVGNFRDIKKMMLMK